ncbi:EAL domain, c-di-GMP-specific phosphodiesterase class I (or its enzymatically inactive variant) [Lachnospiraceae bacterium NE2001]|nr:EAL domain, c-di-GMP-specific phosphodiesterase class I (or its enzymatically inactive variant) [Lachnospiraceae bacterium NE2001]
MHVNINEFHMAFYAAALLVSFTIFMQSIIQKRTDRAHNLAFIVMVCIVMANSVTEMISEFVRPYLATSDACVFVDDVCHILYFVFHCLIAPMFFFYELCLTDAIKKRKDIQVILFSVPIIFMELLVLSNPLTHLLYDHSPSGRFERGPAEYVLYVISAVYIFHTIACIFRFWNAMTFKKRLSLICFLGVVLLGLVVQLVYPDIRCELFAEALGILGIMLLMENEDDRIEAVTGIYNRRGLEIDLDMTIKLGLHCDILSLRITDVGTSLRSIGLTNINNLTNDIAEYLKTKIQRFYIYNIDPSQFIILLGDREQEENQRRYRKLFRNYEPMVSIDELAEDILERFKGNWNMGKTKTSLNPVIIKANIPENFKTVEEVFFFIDSPLPKKLDKQVLDKDDLGYLLRRTEVENAIHRGMAGGGFEVYYQPVYELNSKKLYGAEALLRLHDKELGPVFPDEFIPVIEQMGLIDDVDNMVLGKVCEFIESGIPTNAGMQTLNVNLSMIQCMQKGFVNRINQIVDGYSIDKHMITFEITESVGADDYMKLGEIITELKGSGYQFAMDDYGTGYSNIQSIFSLDFDVVKIDKSILWAAEKGELGMTILTNSINMIRQMKKKIVVEGVETESQIHLLEQLGVDYQQGFYFSKPIPKEDFIREILGVKD